MMTNEKERVMDFQKEEWRDISGYEGLYMVSNFGRVRSRYGYLSNLASDGKTRILKQGNTGRYMAVVLCKNKIKKMRLVHRLVAEAFIPNPNRYPIINHKDENPSNNHFNNLEWCTTKYNLSYGTAMIRRAKSKSKPILQLTMSGDVVRRWNSGEEAKKEGLSKGNICMCCKGIRRHYKGFLWRYE